MILDNVTIASVNGTTNVDNTMKAMNHCLDQVSFGDSIIFTTTKFESSRIRYENIPKLDWMGYNKFIVEELYDRIDTDFVLIVQGDGFIVNSSAWSDDFFNYDYIGAPWSDFIIRTSEMPQLSKFKDQTVPIQNYVGNGGFSFRSKKMLKACKELGHDGKSPEDAYICLVNLAYFKEKGVEFAPVEVADRFSYDLWAEKPFSMHGHFGIHGTRSAPVDFWKDICFHFAEQCGHPNPERKETPLCVI